MAATTSRSADPELHGIVKKRMVHGPCGTHNPASPCMAHVEHTIPHLRAWPVWSTQSRISVHGPCGAHNPASPRMARVEHTIPHLRAWPMWSTQSRISVHGPCGAQNPASPGTRDGIWRKAFPKPHIEVTHCGDDTYPKYRQRSSILVKQRNTNK